MADTVAIVLATFLGPIAAVGISLFREARSKEYNAKYQLFLGLMSARKVFPLPFDWVRNLNLINAVYAKHPDVTSAWRDLYDYLSSGTPPEADTLNEKRTYLLSKMAEALGFSGLNPADIDRYYAPQQHEDAAQRQLALQMELLRVLQAIGGIQVLPRSPTEAPIVSEQGVTLSVGSELHPDSPDRTET